MLIQRTHLFLTMRTGKELRKFGWTWNILISVLNVVQPNVIHLYVKSRRTLQKYTVQIQTYHVAKWESTGWDGMLG